MLAAPPQSADSWGWRVGSFHSSVREVRSLWCSPSSGGFIPPTPELSGVGLVSQLQEEAAWLRVPSWQ